MRFFFFITKRPQIPILILYMRVCTNSHIDPLEINFNYMDKSFVEFIIYSCTEDGYESKFFL